MGKPVGIFSNPQDATKAIVASNLALASAMIRTTRNVSLNEAVKEAIESFKSCASLLKDED